MFFGGGGWIYWDFIESFLILQNLFEISLNNFLPGNLIDLIFNIELHNRTNIQAVFHFICLRRLEVRVFCTDRHIDKHISVLDMEQ